MAGWPEWDQMDELENTLRLAPAYNALAIKRVMDPESRQARAVYDTFLGYSLLTESNEKIVVVIFTSQMVYIVDMSGKYNAERMTENAEKISKKNIKNLHVYRKGLYLVLEFNYGEKVFWGYFDTSGGVRYNYRNLKYLASIGFYGLIAPFSLSNI